MFKRDSVSSVLSIFAKLIARLEEIKRKQEARQLAFIEKAQSLQMEADDAKREAVAAQKAMDKLSKFMED